jgi:hypothetical protein
MSTPSRASARRVLTDPQFPTAFAVDAAFAKKIAFGGGAFPSYPLPPDLAGPLTATFFGDEQPFAERPVSAQDATSQVLLAAVLGRLEAQGAPLAPTRELRTMEDM